jgi:hypothetical protein
MNTLWALKGRIHELMQARRELVQEVACTPEQEATRQQSLALCDDAIRAYVKQEIAVNPNSVHQWMLESKARQEDLKAEKKRLDGLLAAEEGDYARAETLVMETLQEMGEKELSVRGTLRRQGNGGVRAVEIVQPELIPPALQRVIVTVNRAVLITLLRGLSEEVLISLVPEVWKEGAPEPDKEAIREALLKRETCPNCGGSIVGFDLREYGGGANEPCPVCDGQKTVPCGVPGARLAERGEHLRVN